MSFPQHVTHLDLDLRLNPSRPVSVSGFLLCDACGWVWHQGLPHARHLQRLSSDLVDTPEYQQWRHQDVPFGTSVLMRAAFLLEDNVDDHDRSIEKDTAGLSRLVEQWRLSAAHDAEDAQRPDHALTCRWWSMPFSEPAVPTSRIAALLTGLQRGDVRRRAGDFERAQRHFDDLRSDLKRGNIHRELRLVLQAVVDWQLCLTYGKKDRRSTVADALLHHTISPAHKRR
ncbi:hypothetical protein [Deinococcus pimensis]|uniref:hypothetical protein n=1 Tax=Deinococcus pimensis TaxID=309888 RepID=UPI0004BC6A3F|nr:hypothetical protein [Deinococcus pimensis]